MIALSGSTFPGSVFTTPYLSVREGRGDACVAQGSLFLKGNCALGGPYQLQVARSVLHALYWDGYTTMTEVEP